MKNVFTKEAYMRELDEAGVPKKEMQKNGGRAHPNTVRYGNWLRITYPVEFLELYQKALNRKRRSGI